MPVHERFDPADPRLAPLRSMTDAAHRRASDAAHGTYVAESLPVLERAIAAGHRVRSVLIAPRWLEQIRRLTAADVDVFVGDPDLLAAVTGFDMHRGVIAVVDRPAPRALDTILDGRPIVVLENITDQANVRCSKTPKAKNRSRIAILEGVTDHTNVGALFRSAAALGVDAVLVTPDCADPLYRRSVRVSMGTVFQVPWTRIPEWPAGMDVLKDAGYVVAGMTLGEGAITLDELVAEDHEKLALVFGSEGFGITARTDALLDRRVTIPMMGGVDSLNVAAASAVTFYATK